MLARTLLEWCDNKNREAVQENQVNKAIGKTAISGAVEGFVDGTVAVGLICVAICGVGVIIGKLKK